MTRKTAIRFTRSAARALGFPEAKGFHIKATREQGLCRLYLRKRGTLHASSQSIRIGIGHGATWLQAYICAGRTLLRTDKRSEATNG